MCNLEAMPRNVLLEEYSFARVETEGGKRHVADERDEADRGCDDEVEHHVLCEPPGNPGERVTCDDSEGTVRGDEDGEGDEADTYSAVRALRMTGQ